MLHIESLTKNFGRLHALQDVSLQFEQGKVYAVLGPNGSGKSTLLKSVLGLVLPTSGNILMEGENMRHHAKMRHKIGYMPQYAHFPPNVSAQRVLTMLQQLRGKSTKLESLISHFNLTEQLSKRISALSGGNLQKLSAVIAFMFDANLYILDEPSVGLDPLANFKLKELIKEHKDLGKTVIFSSHLMGEVQEVADEVLFIFQGKVLFQCSPAQLMAEENAPNLEQAIASIFQKIHV